LQHWINVIFDTDLKNELQGRRVTSVFIQDINGAFVPREGASRWLMAVQYVPARGERAEDFTAQRCVELVRKGAGRSDVKAKIVDIRQWDVAALIADRYENRRAFLVGDTGHVIPPTGGFGGNTGIHDAHNLAWKLAAVLQGIAGPRLLHTYERERRPVAERTMAQALARLQEWFKDPSKKLPPAEAIIDDTWVVFGHLYRDGALIPDSDVAVDIFENPRQPSGRPGSRASHVLLQHGRKSLSTLDLFNGQWVFMYGPTGKAWLDAVENVPEAHEVDLQCYQIGTNAVWHDVQNRWTAAYGVTESGAVLVRPDGFIAWREKELVQKPESRLAEILLTLSFKDDATASKKDRVA
jgi:hypothetical protein